MAKIIHLIQGLGIGGMERVTLQLAQATRCRGHDVRLVLFDFACHPSAEQYDPGVLLTHFLARHAGVDWRFPVQLAGLISKWRPEIVHAHNDTALFYGALALKLVPRCPSALMVTFHTLPQEKKQLTRWAVRWANRQAVFANAVSRELKWRLAAEGWARDVAVIWNGVDTNTFCPTGRLLGLRGQLGLSDGIHLIGMVARFDANKRQTDLIQAFRMVREHRKDVALILVGEGELREDLHRSTRDHELIFFLRNIQDVAALLRALDVIVLCSEHEGAPRALLEAMACGKPVVATAVGGIPDMLCLDASLAWLLVPPRSPAVLSDSLLRLLACKELRNSLGTRFRHRVLDAFSEESQVAAYMQAYEAVLTQTGGSMQAHRPVTDLPEENGDLQDKPDAIADIVTGHEKGGSGDNDTTPRTTISPRVHRPGQ